MNDTEIQPAPQQAGTTPPAPPVPDYIPSPEDLSEPGATTGGSSTDDALAPNEPPLIDNKDVEQDIRPVLQGKVSGKLKGATWYRKDGTTALSIVLAWETSGPVRSIHYKQSPDGSFKAEPAVTMPPGEVVTEFVAIRGDGPERAAMTDQERIGIETVGRYYVSAVQNRYGKPFDKVLLDWRKALIADGLRAASKDKVNHRCVTDIIGKPVILDLEPRLDQSKVLEDGKEVLKANGKPEYRDDPAKPRKQKVKIVPMVKGK